jgi:heptosyltransferase I
VKVLLVRLSALGDVVHTLPVAENAARTGHEVGWLVEPQCAALLSGNPSVSRVFTADTRAWRHRPFSAPGEVRRLARELTAFGAKATLDLQGLWKSALLSVLGPAPVFGFARSDRREPLSAVFARRQVRPGPEARHVVDKNLALAAAAGIAVTRRAPDARFLLAAPAPEAEAFLSRLPRPFALYHPGAGRPEKTWGEDRHAELARRLAKEQGLNPVVSWGPGDEERAGRLLALLPEAVAAPRLDLAGLAHVASRAALFVGGDTGPLHLADALGTPVVAIFGPTDPARNGPYGQPASVLRGGRDAPVDQASAVAATVLRRA